LAQRKLAHPNERKHNRLDEVTERRMKNFHSRGWSPGEIANQLNSEGNRTPTAGREWTYNGVYGVLKRLGCLA
jgi:hypothetical protein